MGFENQLFVLFGFAFMWCFAAIPDYIQVCKANEPQIDQCIRNAVNAIRPKLVKGIPELGVPAIEPLLLDEIRLRRGPATAALRCDLSNLKAWGASDFVVKELKANVKKSRFDFKIFLPHIYFEGDYDLDMRVLLVNIRGKGPIRGNFTGFEADVIMKGSKFNKNGEQYIAFEKINLNLIIGKSTLDLQNLFSNDAVLREVSNSVINENADLFLNEIKPTLETALSEKFREIANQITSQFTYKELFP